MDGCVKVTCENCKSYGEVLLDDAFYSTTSALEGEGWDRRNRHWYCRECPDTNEIGKISYRDIGRARVICSVCRNSKYGDMVNIDKELSEARWAVIHTMWYCVNCNGGLL